MRRAESLHGRGRSGAAHQERFGAAFAHSVAQRLDVTDEWEVAARLGADEEIGERRAGEELLFARIERPEAGHQPRFGRKGGEQRLRKGVDRLDSHTPAGGVEDSGEERASPVAHVRADILAQRLELARKVAVLQANPVSEPSVDPVRHFRCAGLGEGEAKDRGWIDTRQEQAEDARREHMRLSSPGRGGERGVVAWARRAQLVAFERRKKLQAFRQMETDPASSTTIAA